MIRKLPINLLAKVNAEMLKKLLLTVVIGVGFGGFIQAQAIDAFTQDIFKPIEKSSEERPLHISDFRYQPQQNSGSLFDLPRTNPAAAFLSSAIIPGSGQALNGKWVRAGIYFTAEVVGIIYHLDRNATARRQEKAYEQFTHKNWSVVAYAEWLVNYSQQNQLDNDWERLQADIEGTSPDFSNTKNDWRKVNLQTLRDVENSTPYVFDDRTGHTFSHELPDYGSQQYYELISKYYQFQPGWRDWYGEITTNPNQTAELYRYEWVGRDQPFELFYQGRDRAEEFNDNYRVAGNMLKLLIINHVVSAFDALFTVQLKNSRIETDTNLLRMDQFSVSWHF